MQALSDKLEGIELKLRQLAVKLGNLQTENTSLLDENKQLRVSLSEKTNALDLLKEKLDQPSSLDLEASGENESKHSKKLKKDIERYIKEIDKCIEWLHNT